MGAIATGSAWSEWNIVSGNERPSVEACDLIVASHCRLILALILGDREEIGFHE